MPINATCTNCGKSYQAPDAMSGKSVRCKDCGTVFKILAPQNAPEPGDLDFEALERSFAGEAVDTSIGGPSIDGKGKVSIKRAADVEDIGFVRESGAGVRSNFRYRFPMAKEIDQFLPWVLLIGCVGLLARWCMTSMESGVEEAPSTGVALSRFFLLFGAYLLIIFPAAHIAMHKASRKLRFSMPRAAAWRSFTGFMPLLLLGPGMYMLSGGNGVMLVFGVLLGTAVSVGSITLLYRLFPNEMSTVGIYTGTGAVIGGAFTVAVLFAINLVALSIANMSKSEPDLFVSPIALGLRWQDKPVPQVAIVPKTPPKNVEPSPTTAPTTQETTPTVAPMERLDVPVEASVGTLKMIRKIERPPVNPAFERIITPPVASDSIAIIRDGVIECYNSRSWLRANAGQGFQRLDASIAPNTIGDVAMRILRLPNYRLEAIQLGRAKLPQPIIFDDSQQRSLLGFVNERTLLVLSHQSAKLSLERYDIARAIKLGQTVPFGNDGGEGLDVGDPTNCVRMTPNGKYVLIAGRASSQEGSPGRLALYDVADVSVPAATRNLALDFRFNFQPIGLAINNNGTAAMLLNTDNEAYFTMWQMRDETIDGVVHLASNRPIIERKLGVLSELKPRYWDDNYYDALVWLNEETLLLYGTYLVDARTGQIFNTGMKDIVGQVSEGENVVALVERKQDLLRQLLHVTFDPAAIEMARKR